MLALTLPRLFIASRTAAASASIDSFQTCLSTQCEPKCIARIRYIQRRHGTKQSMLRHFEQQAKCDLLWRRDEPQRLSPGSPAVGPTAVARLRVEVVAADCVALQCKDHK